MTGKELENLTRAEFLKILIAQSNEIDFLKEQLAQAEEKLQKNNAKSDVVFKSASRISKKSEDEIAKQLEIIERMKEEQATAAAENERIIREKCIRMIEETQIKCKKMERATKDKCAEILRLARAQAETEE